jgi:hypothetical protein
MGEGAKATWRVAIPVAIAGDDGLMRRGETTACVRIRARKVSQIAGLERNLLQLMGGAAGSVPEPMALDLRLGAKSGRMIPGRPPPGRRGARRESNAAD